MSYLWLPMWCEPVVPVITRGNYQIDKNFPWSVLLLTTEMMSECLKLKWNHELQASVFTAKF